VIDAIIVSLILAIATYYFIERKIRSNKLPTVIPYLVIMFLILGLFGSIISLGYVPNHYNPPNINKFNAAANDNQMLVGLIEIKNAGALYVHHIGGSGKQTLFLGDSNMQQYAPRIVQLLKNNRLYNRGGILVTECGVLAIPNTRSTDGKSSDRLLKTFQKELANNSKIDRIVISERWCTYFSQSSRWEDDKMSLITVQGRDKALLELDSFLGDLMKLGKKVYLTLNIPTGIELDPKGFYPRNFLGRVDPTRKVLSKESFLVENGILLGKISAIAKKNGVEVIDPLDYLCTNGICIAEDEEGMPIRYDDGHLRPGYVREQVKYLDRTVEP